MKEREARSARVVACLLLGRLFAALGLIVCLTHFLFGRPRPLWRACAATLAGAALLGEAASLLNDRRIFIDEAVRAAGLAGIVIAAAVVRAHYARAPRGVGPRLKLAGAAGAAGFAGAALWLRRRRPPAEASDEQA